MKSLETKIELDHGTYPAIVNYECERDFLLTDSFECRKDRETFEITIKEIKVGPKKNHNITKIVKDWTWLIYDLENEIINNEEN